MDYRSDSPQLLLDFLSYHETIKAHSQRTVDEYYLDMRNFFRYLKQVRDPALADKRLDEIDIRDIDLNFIAAITLTDIPEPLPPFIPFQAVPLREVIRDIEAIFGVSVSGKEKYGDLVFTGFIITSDMDGTLEAVFHSCGIPYEISGTEILLK